MSLLADIQELDIGKHVRHLTLDLRLDGPVPGAGEWPPTGDVREGILAKIVRTTQNTREIIVHTTSNVEFTMLLEALKSFEDVEDLTVIETLTEDPWLRQERSFISPFMDGLVRTILNSSGSKLRSLTVDGESSMSLETFEALRSKATRLQTLLLQCFLGIHARDALCQPRLWACSDTLEHLGLYSCDGAHNGAIVSGIGNGLISTTLRSLDIVMCGSHDDLQSLPYPIKAQTPVLERIWVEHVINWEAILIGKLGAKDVLFTHMPRAMAVELVEGSYFRGMQTLKVVGLKELGRDDSAIVKACERRSVKLSTDAIARKPCSCDLRE